MHRGAVVAVMGIVLGAGSACSGGTTTTPHSTATASGAVTATESETPGPPSRASAGGPSASRTPRSSSAAPSQSGGAGRVVAVGPMTVQRAAHSATALLDRRVLIAGGCTADSCEAGDGAATAELFDPATGSFTRTGDLAGPRVGHGAALLPDGRVLLMGGFRGRSVTDTTELFDPVLGMFQAGPRMTAPRGSPVVARLADGRLLVAGGYDGRAPLGSAELFDPASMTFAPTGGMAAARDAHVGVALTDGRVLVVGGNDGQDVLSSSELYDPVAGTWSRTGSMSVPRHKAGAALLGDGRVLVVGGADSRDGRGSYSTAEIYDPAQGSFVQTGVMASTRYKLSDALVALPDGRVLVAGGGVTPELFDPTTGRFASVDGRLQGVHAFATATLLAAGGVLITGGYDEGIHLDDRAWRWSPG